MGYAANTEVPVDRTKYEIEQLLIKYGAKAFQSGWAEGQAIIAFQLESYTMKFILPIPSPTDKRFHEKVIRRRGKVKLTESQAIRLHEQEVRRRWRALLLVVKAKLEAIASGISTLVNEFMAFIVIPSGETLGDWIYANALGAIQGGQMPRMLTTSPAGPRIVESNE